MLKSQPHSGTDLGGAVDLVTRNDPHDRLIVLTDEQSATAVGQPRAGAKGYMVNVAAHQYGVATGKWVSINGWSEAVIDYVQELERIGVG